MKARPATLITLGFLLTAAGLSRAARIPVVAEVDGQPVVTYLDLARFFGGDPSGKAVTAEDVRAFTEDKISAHILVLEAEKAGLDRVPYVVETLEDYRQFLLWEKITEYVLRDEVFTEEELRRFYETDRQWRKYSVLTARNREDALAARRALADGMPWEEAVARYSVFPETLTNNGVMKIPMVYDGKPAAVALYATPVGGYSDAVVAPDDIRWQVFRCDKVVHGRIDTYEQGRPGVLATLRGLRAAAKQKDIVAGLRARFSPRREDAAWQALQRGPFAAFLDKYHKRDAVVSWVGDVPVTGYEYCLALTDYLWPDPEAWDTYRERDPADFAYVTDKILTRLEDRAYLFYYAREQGIPSSPTVVRDLDNYRSRLLIDALAATAFAPTLPAVSEEDARRYYDAHPEQFQTPEVVEVYLVALPDRARAREFHEAVKKDGDIVKIGEDYIHAQAEVTMELPQPPPEVPFDKQEWFGVVRVLREPSDAEPDKTFAAELRPRVFPVAPLHQLSGLFQLADGRWAFYAPIFYQPFTIYPWEDPQVRSKAAKLAAAAYVAGPEAERKTQEWIASLRALHKVKVKETAFADAAGWLNRAHPSAMP